MASSEVLPASKSNYERIINILLVGKTGQGKSSTGNTILQIKDFEVKDNKMSTTKGCQMECREIDNMLIRVVDTPGFMDTRNINPEDILQSILEAFSQCPEGINAIVYVMAYDVKFTPEEQAVMELLKKAFGPTFIEDFCVIIMTKGANFDMDHEDNDEILDFKNWLEQQTEPQVFRELIDCCKKRVFLFYNKGEHYTKKKEKCRAQFIDFIKNRQSQYKSEVFQLCINQRNKIVEEYALPTQKQYVQEGLSLVRQDIQEAIQTARKMVDEVDEIMDQTNDRKVEQKLNSVKIRLQDIITKLKDEDEKKYFYERMLVKFGSKLPNKDKKYKSSIEFIDELNKLKNEIDEIVHLTPDKKVQKLTAMDHEIGVMKFFGSLTILEGFALGFVAALGGLVVGAVALAISPVVVIVGLGVWAFTKLSDR